MPKQSLPPHLQEQHDKVFVNKSAPSHTQTIEDPNAYAALHIDNSFILSEFKSDFSVDIRSKSDGDKSLLFDMKGIDPPLANAFRRIMLSEVPTMAIERINIFQNTSIIPDEVLAHRIGLIPIMADPTQFNYVGGTKHDPAPPGQEDDAERDQDNTLVFTLHVKCTRKPGVADTASDDDKYSNHKVLASDMKWVAQGEQAENLGVVGPVGDCADILLAKLRPGQEIELEMFCQKGVGKDHAKWSPVGTAFYRMLPEIHLTRPVKGQEAKELMALCSESGASKSKPVFDIEDSQLIVKNPTSCTMCRNCIQDPKWDQIVKLRRVRNHFCFSVESIGAVSPADIVSQSTKVLKHKCQKLLEQVQNMTPDSDAQS